MTLGEIIAKRRKCAMTTRGDMLCAARQRFLAESYENVGLRDIARDVGVDVALISRYFGSKEALFREVLRSGKEETFSGPLSPAELPAYLASLIVQEDECAQQDHVAKLLIILRSASSPAAAEIVREAIRKDVLDPLGNILDGPDAAQRAGLILALLLGSTILQTVMAVEPDRSCNEATRRARLERLFEAALAG